MGTTIIDLDPIGLHPQKTTMIIVIPKTKSLALRHKAAVCTLDVIAIENFMQILLIYARVSALINKEEKKGTP